ncbi:MAG TPA: hypothetical protein VFT29_02195 [Gemmatimonadaceae bacterium]|nr:hypothetical protein [Gemmatimonadaceae bacterium]
MLLLALLLQVQAADTVYSTPALRAFVERAAVANRAPPPSLAGYRAAVESELAFILRDSLGREIVGQVEQIAARADWERSGRYDLHIVGYRSQSAGAPYSALTFTRMYTVPTLYGNRLVLGMNDGIAWSRRDSTTYRKRLEKDTAAGRERLRAIHPLAVDREKYYRFTGGDTVATMYARDRAIRILRVHAEPVMSPRANFYGFQGELDFDADRHQLVRMRGRLVSMTTAKDPLLLRRTGAVAVAYIELENAEVNGQYWLPAYQRSEFQVQMGVLGEVRPVYRLVSRFRNYSTSDTVVSLASVDSASTDTVLAPTRAKLTYASKDSVSRFGDWEQSLGTAISKVGADDFIDLAPDVWKTTGKPRVDYWPSRMEDMVRFNRVEGAYTGVSTVVRFRDMVPGLVAKGHVGWAWRERVPRGAAALSLTRGRWINSVRAQRELASTNDFKFALESGLSIGPLIAGTDDADYVDRWSAAFSTTRIIHNLDRALISTEVAVMEDRPERARFASAPMYGTAWRSNRNARRGRYGLATGTLEFHPRVTGESLSPGLGARLMYEVAAGQLDWQRVETRIAARRYWRGWALSSRLDAGAVFGSAIPPQTLYEMGGGFDLPSYEYKEFGGDRAALGRALLAYQIPVLRTPTRLKGIVVPGLGPGIGIGAHGGWTQASSAAARSALLQLGGDGTTPLSRPTERVRATADVRVTFLSGALGAGFARPIDQPGKWKPFFVWGAAF